MAWPPLPGHNLAALGKTFNHRQLRRRRSQNWPASPKRFQHQHCSRLAEPDPLTAGRHGALVGGTAGNDVITFLPATGRRFAWGRFITQQHHQTKQKTVSWVRSISHQPHVPSLTALRGKNDHHPKWDWAASRCMGMFLRGARKRTPHRAGPVTMSSSRSRKRDYRPGGLSGNGTLSPVEAGAGGIRQMLRAALSRCSPLEGLRGGCETGSAPRPFE